MQIKFKIPNYLKWWYKYKFLRIVRGKLIKLWYCLKFDKINL